MPSLPTDAIAPAEFIVRHLCRPIELTQGERFVAVAETQHAIGGDTWFWSDDNAKVIELLSRPELWRRFPEATGEIIRFVRAMCDGPFIFRRVSVPRLELAETHGSAATYLHSLMRIKCDLPHGVVVAGLRFHDERSADHLSLTGNYVEFTHKRRRLRVPVEGHIEAVDAALCGHTLRLQHGGDLHFKAASGLRRLGRLNYLYTIDARSMLIEIEASLDLDQAAPVSDVILTIAHDNLSPAERNPYWHYTTIASGGQAGPAPLFTAGKAGRRLVDQAGTAYYAIRQRHISGDALAIHSTPREPGRLCEIESVVERARSLRGVVARYRFAGPQRGARLVVGEHKLLTAGGFYDRIADYSAFMREAVATKAQQRAARDLSISYDYGVKINAFAKCFAVCAAGDAPASPGLSAEELRSLFDRYLDYYFELLVERHAERPNAIFSRDLAFVILGVVTMYRATQSEAYLARLRRLCDVLLEFEVRSHDIAGGPASGFMMRMDSRRAGYVDCHSGALLALTQAARFLRDARLPAAIERGLASYCLETSRVDVGATRKIDTVSTVVVDAHGKRHSENTLWNFKVGLTLRLFGALRNSPNPELQAIVLRHRDRIELFELIMRRQLENSIAEHGEGVEVRTSFFSGETNSETQPWVALGLFGHPWD